MIANLRLLPNGVLCGVFDQLPRLSVMLTCVAVRRLSLVGCISRGRGHRSHLSRVLRLVAVPSQILLCRCIREHRVRGPIRDLLRTGGSFCPLRQHFPLSLRLCFA